MKHIYSVLLIALMFSCHGVDDLQRSDDERYIGIQELGNIPDRYIDTIKACAEQVYGREVVIMPKLTLPQSAFTNVKTPRYRADSLLRFLKTKRVDSIQYILGIMKEDISCTKKDEFGKPKEPAWKYNDWGILGLGYRPGPCCVVSTYRMKTKSDAKFYDRLRKISMHELGHNMGLKHCDRDSKCLMRDAAETVRTVDQVDLKLCDYCMGRI